MKNMQVLEILSVQSNTYSGFSFVLKKTIREIQGIGTTAAVKEVVRIQIRKILQNNSPRILMFFLQ